MSGSTTPPLPLSGGPPPVPTFLPPNAPRQPATPDEVTLVTTPDQVQVATPRGETDARTAQARALAVYLRTLKRETGGQLFQFKQVLSTWSEPERLSNYPGAVVLTEGEGAYEASRFTPAVGDVLTVDQASGQRGALLSDSELVADLQLQVWATNPVERFQLVAMLEDAFAPVDWRYGFVLECPWYFGRRVAYEKTALEYIDSDESAMRRFRRANIRLRARLAVTRLSLFPVAKPMVKGSTLQVAVDGTR